jgi:hypothetical protein
MTCCPNPTPRRVWVPNSVYSSSRSLGFVQLHVLFCKLLSSLPSPGICMVCCLFLCETPTGSHRVPVIIMCHVVVQNSVTVQNPIMCMGYCSQNCFCRPIHPGQRHLHCEVLGSSPAYPVLKRWEECFLSKMQSSRALDRDPTSHTAESLDPS